MKIATIEVFPIALPMKAVLTLPRGASHTPDVGRRSSVVKITADDGTVGWGESMPSPRWSAETLESCVAAQRRYLGPAIIGHDPFDIAGLHARMDRELAPLFDPGQPIAKAAIDIAVHDLVCRKLGITLQSWLGAKRRTSVQLARLVSAGSADDAARITREAHAQGFRGFKVKVGHAPEKDEAIVAAVIEAAQGAYVWPDANQGYDVETAIARSRAFERLGITLFEQPLPVTDIAGLQRLMRSTGLTIALDESVLSAPMLLDFLKRDLVQGIAIKLGKVGGIHHARRICDMAQAAGVRLIGSGLMDPPLGFAASVHLFAAYGMDLPVDLNGPQHIAEDYLAEPFPMRGQEALVPEGPGLGVTVDEAKLSRFALDVGLR
jgi:muconate cycloisomerase